MILTASCQILVLGGARESRAEAALGTSVTDDYDIHDEMSLKKTKLIELFHSTATKRKLTKYLALGVSYGTSIAINKPHSLPDTCTRHSHEEADTQIPLRILLSIEYNAAARKALHFDVYSKDIDVLTLLLDLVSRIPEKIGESTSILLHKENKPRKIIDIKGRMDCIGVPKCRGVLGFHDLSGGDWGGKFVGVMKERWTKLYLSRPPNDPVLECFSKLGTFPHTHFTRFGESLHDDLKSGWQKKR